MVKFFPVVSVATVTVAFAVPATVGENLMLALTACEGFNATGVVNPETANPVPEIVMPVIEIAAVPVFVMVRFCDALEPIFTVPRLSEVELAERLPVLPLPVLP